LDKSLIVQWILQLVTVGRSLPNTSLQGGQVVVEKLLTAMKHIGISHICSPMGDRITLSIGVSGLIPTLELTPQSFLTATDIALYEEKIGTGTGCGESHAESALD
jgi:PleD family two-component response regulator